MPWASSGARQRRRLRGSIPRMSAACSQVRAPLNARMITSWTFIARSTAAAAKTMITPLVDHGCTAERSKSGHFTCSRERTDHVLPTSARGRVDRGGRPGYDAAVRTQLAEYRVPARNPSGHSANKIHDDAVARQLGFRGGLVPGVTVYAYMTRPLVAACGREWVEGGTASVRFVKPVYAGEVVTVRAAAVPAHPPAPEAHPLNPPPHPCAVLTARLPELGAAPSVDP